MYNNLNKKIMEKKIYEEPTVQKVEFDFKTRIAASTCTLPSSFADATEPTPMCKGS